MGSSGVSPPRRVPLVSPVALPTVMASPPTVVLSAAFGSLALAVAGSTISSAYNVPSIVVATQLTVTPTANEDWFTFFGQPVNQRGQNTGNNQVSLQSDLAVTGGSGSGCPFRVEFLADCSALDIVLMGLGSQYRLWVDGLLVTQRAQSGPSATASMYNLNVDFTTRAMRRVTFDGAAGVGFAGVNIGPTDMIWPSAVPVGPRLLVLGDSYVNGANGVGAIDTFAFTLGELLGCRDVQCSGLGGTGYTTSSGYASRIATDVIPHDPDIVIVQGSVNDAAASPATTVAAATAVWTALRAGLPTAVLIATGELGPFPLVTGHKLMNDALIAAAQASTAIDLVIDAAPGASINAATGNTANWFSGTGKVGSTNGSGNADRYDSSDSTHPSQTGHDYLALRLAAAIAPFLGRQTGWLGRTGRLTVNP